MAGEPPDVDGLSGHPIRHFRSLTVSPVFVKFFKATVQSEKMVEVKSARVRTAR
jgi:hypothetical protein